MYRLSSVSSLSLVRLGLTERRNLGCSLYGDQRNPVFNVIKGDLDDDKLRNESVISVSYKIFIRLILVFSGFINSNCLFWTFPTRRL